jgi:hypothetical protein
MMLYSSFIFTYGGKPEGRDHWGDPGIDGRIVLRWIFRKWDVRYVLNWVGSV